MYPCPLCTRQRQGEAGGRVELRETSYYTTVASALSAALSRAMRAEVESGVITTLQDFLDRQQQMIADFTALIEPVFGRYRDSGHGGKETP